MLRWSPSTLTNSSLIRPRPAVAALSAGIGVVGGRARWPKKWRGWKVHWLSESTVRQNGPHGHPYGHLRPYRVVVVFSWSSWLLRTFPPRGFFVASVFGLSPLPAFLSRRPCPAAATIPGKLFLPSFPLIQPFTTCSAPWRPSVETFFPFKSARWAAVAVGFCFFLLQ